MGNLHVCGITSNPFKSGAKKVYIQIIQPCVVQENLLDLEEECQSKGIFAIPLKNGLNQEKQEVLSCEIENQKKVNLRYDSQKLCIDYVSDGNEKDKDNRCWIVLNDRFFSHYRVSVYKPDVLKIGKIILTIVDIQILQSTPKSPSSLVKNALSSKPDFFTVLKGPQIPNPSKICKFCLEEETPYNKLISPCKCSGTLKYVHASCLQRWGREKVQSFENEYITIFMWEDFFCDLCKGPLPGFDSGEFWAIMKGKRAEFSYVAMKSKIEEYNYLFYINLTKKKFFKMGSYVDCEVQLNDDSVSGYHSKIYLENGEVFIEDMGSKYGTLLLYKEPLTMENILMQNKELCLQHCGFLMKVTMKKAFLLK